MIFYNMSSRVMWEGTSTSRSANNLDLLLVRKRIGDRSGARRARRVRSVTDGETSGQPDSRLITVPREEEWIPGRKGEKESERAEAVPVLVDFLIRNDLERKARAPVRIAVPVVTSPQVSVISQEEITVGAPRAPVSAFPAARRKAQRLLPSGERFPAPPEVPAVRSYLVTQMDYKVPPATRNYFEALDPQRPPTIPYQRVVPPVVLSTDMYDEPEDVGFRKRKKKGKGKMLSGILRSVL